MKKAVVFDGQFAQKLGGQFELESGGQFAPKLVVNLTVFSRVEGMWKTK